MIHARTFADGADVIRKASESDLRGAAKPAPIPTNYDKVIGARMLACWAKLGRIDGAQVMKLRRGHRFVENDINQELPP